MQVFKAFFKIAQKRLPSICIYFVIFVTLTFLLSGNGQEEAEDLSTSTDSLNICVLDEDQTDASEALTDYLGSIHNLVTLDNDKEVIQDNIYYRYVSYVLTIPKGFEDNLLNGNTENLLANIKVPSSFDGNYVDQQITEYMSTLNLYLNGGYDLADAISQTASSLSDEIDVTAVSFQADQEQSSVQMFYFFQYLPYIFIVLLINGLAPIIITFNKKELGERISCSALSLSSKNRQISLACIVYCLITWLIFMVVGCIAYGSQMFSAAGRMCMLNSFIFLLIGGGFTILISCFSPDFNILNLFSNVLGLGLGFLGGVFVPQWLLADNVLSFAKFLPTYWYVKANNMIGGLSSEGFVTGNYWFYLGIEFLFVVALFCISLCATKLNRQQKNS